MIFLYVITFSLLILSFIFDRKKTIKALKIALKRFLKILPALLDVVIIISVILYLVPNSLISKSVGKGKNKFISLFIAALVGSITLMPGFVAFPLCGILLKKGVPYMVLSGFTTTLMMVGFITFPLEKKFFGTKVTIIRNVISFFIALTVAFVTGIFFGEIF